MKPVVLTTKQTFHTSVLSLACISLSSTSLAVTVEEVPNPRQENGGWVTDMANILSSSTEAAINRQISELEAQNGSEIAVVTVPETAPASTPKEFTTALFNHWGIGKNDQDNGVLFLISKGDRRVEIETGYGIEAVLPDAQVSHMIEQKITPQFKKGNFDSGTLAGTQSLVTVLRDDTAKATQSSTSPQPNTTAQVVQSPAGPTDTASQSDSGLDGWLWILLGGLGVTGLAAALRYAASKNDDDDGHGSGRKGRYRPSSSYYSGSSGSSSCSGGYSGDSSGGSSDGGSSGGGGAGGSF